MSDVIGKHGVTAGVWFFTALGFFVGWLTWGTPAAADDHEDPYPGYFEVTDGDPPIRFNPTTGESWILACPGTMTSCAWEPLEVREP